MNNRLTFRTKSNRPSTVRKLAFFRSGRGALLAGLLLGSGLMGMGALQAQSGTEAITSQLNLPQDITLLSNNDPNFRKATAVINGYVITGTDIDRRVQLFLDAYEANSKISDEELKRLRLQVLNNLIDETLQIQEAQALEIEIPQTEIAESYARVAQGSFGEAPDKLDDYLRKIGSSPESLKRQIQGELAWQRLLGRNVQPFINVSNEEANELLDRLKAAKGTYEYELREIYLSATPETQQAVYENGRLIMEQLKQGGNFAAFARQFSEASTAARGGDLGWIRLALLPNELAAATRGLEPGQMVGPIEVAGGFSIITLTDKRQVLTADPRDAVLSLMQITKEMPAGASPQEAQAVIRDFASRVQQIRGCGDAGPAATAMGAKLLSNDQVVARDLPGQLQEMLLGLSVGQTSQLFGSAEVGISALMLCGRDDPVADAGPSAEQLRSQLEEDRIGKRARRYLRDLRRDAIIEYD